MLEAAFGSHSDAKDGYELMQLMVRDTLVISLLSIPAYFVTVCLIGRKTCACQSRSSSSPTRCSVAPCFPCHQTPVFIQMQGFAFMAVLYTVIGVFWASLAEIQWLLLVLYAGTFFFANYGPNTTSKGRLLRLASVTIRSQLISFSLSLSVPVALGNIFRKMPIDSEWYQCSRRQARGCRWRECFCAGRRHLG